MKWAWQEQLGIGLLRLSRRAWVSPPSTSPPLSPSTSTVVSLGTTPNLYALFHPLFLIIDKVCIFTLGLFLILWNFNLSCKLTMRYQPCLYFYFSGLLLPARSIVSSLLLKWVMWVWYSRLVIQVLFLFFCFYRVNLIIFIRKTRWRCFMYGHVRIIDLAYCLFCGLNVDYEIIGNIHDHFCHQKIIISWFFFLQKRIRDLSKELYTFQCLFVPNCLRLPLYTFSVINNNCHLSSRLVLYLAW